MKFLKRYNESHEFDIQDYFDYLIDEENNIGYKGIKDRFAYIEYINMSNEKIKNIEKYLSGKRFKDVVILKHKYYDTDEVFSILIIDKTFYNDNKNLVYDNIEWIDHEATGLIKNISVDMDFSIFQKVIGYMYRALNIPNNISMIKFHYDDRVDKIEIMYNEMDNPLVLTLDNLPYVQYKIFEYCVK